MFLGTQKPRLDDKGRLILPAKWRDELLDGFVLTRGQERCLYLFPTQEFERMHEELQRAPLTRKEVRDYLRVFLSGASDEVPDKQGRFTVPPMLREYAGLDRELAVIGMGSRLELWDLPTWESYLAGAEQPFSDKDGAELASIV